MKLPNKLKIKGKEWSIKRRWGLSLNGEMVDGLCDNANRTILIDQSLTGDDLNLTFFHELNHAILFELHILSIDGPLQEVLVEGVADVYLDLFKFRWKS